MPAQPQRTYPESRYAPSSLPDLSSLDERRRLTPAAARAFLRIADHWQIRDEDARALLGDMSHGSFYQLKQKPGSRPFDQDRLRRLSYLVGIFKALNILYSEKLADRWMQLPNKNPLFAGRTPLAFILAGGIPAMDVVRRLLDARRGGH